jgi:hypothetical protein
MFFIRMKSCGYVPGHELLKPLVLKNTIIPYNVETPARGEHFARR